MINISKVSEYTTIIKDLISKPCLSDEEEAQVRVFIFDRQFVDILNIAWETLEGHISRKDNGLDSNEILLLAREFFKIFNVASQV